MIVEEFDEITLITSDVHGDLLVAEDDRLPCLTTGG